MLIIDVAEHGRLRRPHRLALVAAGALLFVGCAPAASLTRTAGPIAEAAIESGPASTVLKDGDGPAVADVVGGETLSDGAAQAASRVVQAAPAEIVRAPVRIPKPAVPDGPRRVGLQAGHWRTGELPPELRRLEPQTGTSWGGYAEWQLNLDIANRVAAILRGQGFVVDVLPTLMPESYLADAFVALHADGDPNGVARGFKAAHGSRRGPYEDTLVQDIVDEYGAVTGLPHDEGGISRNMLSYYAFSYSRFPWAAAAHTPSAILEMGFMTSAADRVLLLQRPEVVARGVANGVLRFLEEVPGGMAFAEDIVLPPQPPRAPGPPPSGQAPVAGTPPRVG